MTPSPMTLIPHPALNLEVSDVPRYDSQSLCSVPQLESPIADIQCPLPLPQALALCSWKGHQMDLKGIVL